MKNEFVLQKIWEHRTFYPSNLRTSDNLDLEIIEFGELNHTNGPDFTNAVIRINNQIIRGDIEVHYQSSDWNNHNHQTDIRYNNVILHVVWKHNSEVKKQNQQIIPTLELKTRVSASLLHHVVHQPNEPLCNAMIHTINKTIVYNQFKRALEIRNDKKTEYILRIHKILGEDWWRTWLYLHLSAFLGIHNEPAALHLAKIANKRYVLTIKCEDDLTAYFFGIAGWISGSLEEKTEDSYSLLLQQKFQFYTFKYNWELENNIQWNYRQIRPASFPQIRMAQFCSWFSKKQSDFNFLTDHSKPNWKQEIIMLQDSPNKYWETHYKLGVESAKHPTGIGRSVAENVAINSWHYGLICYAQALHNEQLKLNADSLLHSLKFEHNSTTKWMLNTFHSGKNAEHSQELIAQYKNYCSLKKCHSCLVGKEILQYNPMKYQQPI